jgi:integrase
LRATRRHLARDYHPFDHAFLGRAKKEGLPLEPFTVHDLRRTGSTLLDEPGFNNGWIEKCLAQEDGRASRGVYNKAEQEVQGRHMMQEWSDIRVRR